MAVGTPEQEGTKVCAECGKRKLLSQFYPAKGYKDGKYRLCKECNRLHAYEWRKAHPEEWKAYSREYRRRYRAAGRDTWVNKQYKQAHGVPFPAKTGAAA